MKRSHLLGLACSVLLSAAVRAELVTLTDNGAWTWFNDPRCVFDSKTNRIYTGWITNKGDVQFASHELKDGKTTVVDLRKGFEPDDHNNPGLLLNDDGVITAFYTSHRTEYPEKAILYRVLWPEDVGFKVSAEHSIFRDDDVKGNKKNTYCNPFHLSAEKRSYIFSRGANFNPVYRTRDDRKPGDPGPGQGTFDENAQWSESKNFIMNAPQRPYVKYDSNGVDRVLFLFTDGNPGSSKNNIYFAYLKDGDLHRADGGVIKKLSDGPIKPSQGDVIFQHTDTADAKSANGQVGDAPLKMKADNAWCWDVAYEPETQHPVATFASFPSQQKHLYHYARFDGKKWNTHTFNFIAGPGLEGSGNSHYSAGIVLDHTDPSIVYLSRKIGDEYVLEQWKTSDGGNEWTHRELVRSKDKIVRPYVPINRPKDKPMVLFMEGKYQGWDNAKGEAFETGVKLWRE